jgi:hypothetical protein
MEADEVIEIIEEAIKAIKSYRSSQIREKIKIITAKRQGTLNETVYKKLLTKVASDKNSILNESKELIKEAYMLGQSGQPCPRCGGTGRI